MHIRLFRVVSALPRIVILLKPIWSTVRVKFLLWKVLIRRRMTGDVWSRAYDLTQLWAFYTLLRWLLTPEASELSHFQLLGYWTPSLVFIQQIFARCIVLDAYLFWCMVAMMLVCTFWEVVSWYSRDWYSYVQFIFAIMVEACFASTCSFSICFDGHCHR